VYAWSSGFGAKYANPATLPTSSGYDVTFSPDGTDIAVCDFGTSPVSVYPWSAGFGARYSNPAVTVGTKADGVAFTPDGQNIALAHFRNTTSPYISVYEWTPGVGFGTKYADPSTAPTGYGTRVAFSPIVP
jgi:hypothetical protein